MACSSWRGTSFKLADFGDSIFKLLDELFFATGDIELAQVDGHKFGPIHCYD